MPLRATARMRARQAPSHAAMATGVAAGVAAVVVDAIGATAKPTYHRHPMVPRWRPRHRTLSPPSSTRRRSRSIRPQPNTMPNRVPNRLPRHPSGKRPPQSRRLLKQPTPRPLGAAPRCANRRPSASAATTARRMSPLHRRVSHHNRSSLARPRAMTPIGRAVPAGGAGGCLARTDPLGHPARGSLQQSRGSVWT